MKTLYLLCGMPFSGKTTLGKLITKYLDSFYISLDDINATRGLNGGDGIPIEEWERTHFLAMQQLEELMNSGKDVVLDDTNCFRWLRDRFRNLGLQHNYQTIVVFLDIPLVEILQRMANNEIDRRRRGVKPEIIQEMFGTFESPQSDEIVIRYATEQPVAEWIAEKFKDVN